MDLLFVGGVFLLMGVGSPTVLSLGTLRLALILRMRIIMKYRRWFCFVLFLLYIGGIIVIIIYFSTLIPNQRFNFNLEGLVLFCLVGIVLIKMLVGERNIFCFRLNGVDRLSLYERGNIYISIRLLVFLFVLMVAVVIVTNFCGGPLRPLR